MTSEVPVPQTHRDLVIKAAEEGVSLLRSGQGGQGEESGLIGSLRIALRCEFVAFAYT